MQLLQSHEFLYKYGLTVESCEFDGSVKRVAANGKLVRFNSQRGMELDSPVL